MATKTNIQAETRARSGSGVLKKLRREGLLPSVIYGKGLENINLKIDAKVFRDILANSSSDNIVVNLEIDGKESRLAFLKDVQYDALTGYALHADFRAIDSDTEITAQIPAQLNGTAPGIKSGGVVEQYVHAIEITCLPNDLPETIEINISNMELGDSLHLGDIAFPAGVKHTLNDDVVVVHIGKAGAGADEIEAADEEAAAEESAEATPAEDSEEEEAKPEEAAAES